MTFDDYGAKIRVRGKTGDRSLRLTISVPLLATWLNMHSQSVTVYAILDQLVRDFRILGGRSGSATPTG